MSTALQVAEYELFKRTRVEDDTDSEESSSDQIALKHVLKKILWDAGRNKDRCEFTKPLQDWIVLKLEKFGFLVSCQCAPYREACWLVSWPLPAVVEGEDDKDYQLASSLLGSSPPAGLFLDKAPSVATVSSLVLPPTTFGRV